MLSFRTATEADLTAIWQIILQAKSQMSREGKHQWDEQYPAVANIEADIQNRHAYVLSTPDEIAAYGAVIFGEEPAYRHITGGKWLSQQPYCVVHRLAVADKMKRQGIARQFMLEAETLARKKQVFSLKVDTNYDNFYMQRLPTGLQFSYCGEIRYGRGIRMGYEKLLDNKETVI